MSKLFFQFSAFAVSLFLSSILMAQSVEFDFSDGSQSSYNLEDIAQITFTGTVLNLELKDGTVYSNDISTIQKFQYEGNAVGIEQAIENMNALQVQTYPNPNNGNFQIAYTLPQATNIQVSIINLEGKIIENVFDGRQNAGKHVLEAQLNELTSGTYICRISSETMTISKQVIIKK